MSDISQHARSLLAETLAKLDVQGRLLVAYSGGCDSTCLLHALIALKPAQPVLALHVNHGLSPQAQAWQDHCQAFAECLGVAFIAEQVRVDPRGEGLEAAARQARYGAFARHLQAGDLLLMAHHGDDQAETVLLRLFRGAGARGLAGMQATRALANARLARPWLALGRADIERYARLFDLQYVDDESNAQVHFDRNFIRHRLMPLVAERWPEAAHSITRAATLLGQQESLLEHQDAKALVELSPRVERLGESIEFGPLQAWPEAQSARLLRHWLAGFGLNPSLAQLEQIISQLAAGDDRQPGMQLGGVEIRRFRARLYCFSSLAAPGNTALVCDTADDASALPDGSVLMFKPTGGGLRPGRYSIRFRQGAMRGHPSTRGHSQTLKKLLQQYRLEPWLRDRIPLLYQGDELAAVGDLWIEKSHYVAEQGVTPSWRYPAAAASPQKL